MQDGVIARWQLIRAGLSERRAECWVRGMQPLRDGVFLAGLAPPTQRQLWWAAVLSQPGHRAQPRERRRVLWAAAGGRRRSSRSRASVTADASTAAGFTSATRSRCAARSPSTTASPSPPSSARSSICGRTCPPRARSRLLREALRLGADGRAAHAVRHPGAPRAPRRGLAARRGREAGGPPARALPLRRRGVGGRPDRRRRARSRPTSTSASPAKRRTSAGRRHASSSSSTARATTSCATRTSAR